MNKKTIPTKIKRQMQATRPLPSLPPTPTVPAQPQAPPQRWAYEPPPAPAKPGRTGLKSLAYFSVGLLLAVLLFILIVAGGGLLYLYRSDLILPGTTVGDLDVRWRTTGEATALLEQQWQTQGILLTSDTLNQALTPAALGLNLDIPPAISAAYAQGRSWETLQALLEGQTAHFTPTLYFDEGTARRTLEALAPQYAVEPVSADIQQVEGLVEAVPASPGRRLDVAATLAPLQQNAAEVLAEGELPLVMATVPPERGDVRAVVNAANQLLANTVQISAYDPISDETATWEVTGEEWRLWVSVWLDEDQPDGFGWELDQEQAQAALVARFDDPEAPRYLPGDEIGPAIIAAIVGQRWTVDNLRLYHRPQSHTVQPGETLSSIGFDYGMPYPWLEAANPNLGNSLSPGQVITIPSPDELLPLPVIENKRIVVSLSEQKAWVYENGEVKWEWLASTGIDSSPTAPGIFQVQTHQANAYAANWDLWMPDFMGIYRPAPSVDFMNGFHGFPTRNGSTLLWTGDLGHPVTFGCILLDSQNAAKLFAWAEAGVVVEIRP